jgi:hypothetical protein
MKNNAFLTEDEVRQIITLYASGDWRQWQLARRFKVHRTQIGRIVNLRSWLHIGASRGMKSAIKCIASNKL